MNRPVRWVAAGATAATLLLLAACGNAAAGGGDDATELNVVGFSVLESAYNKVTVAFEETDAGSGVEFLASYGASGDQSRAVEAGAPASLVHLSLEPDLQRLVDAGIVAADWNAGPTKGILSQSVVSFVVRPGNPKGIEGWDDLIADDVEVITPNPASSGSAKWNILAAWGQVLAEGGSEKDAEAYLAALLDNAAALPDSARDATTLFQSGTGDVLLSYENEAILAIQNGADFDYVVPDTTLLIENPGAVVEGAPAEAQSFLDFVVSAAGQTIFAALGYRPIVDVAVEVEGANDPANPFPAPGTLLTVAATFGGWPVANTKYFDAESGIVTRLLAETGKE
jgi:sulfate transport system substrate-binding protein